MAEKTENEKIEFSARTIEQHVLDINGVKQLS
jgi:hypothetical protein